MLLRFDGVRAASYIMPDYRMTGRIAFSVGVQGRAGRVRIVVAQGQVRRKVTASVIERMMDGDDEVETRRLFWTPVG